MFPRATLSCFSFKHDLPFVRFYYTKRLNSTFLSFISNNKLHDFENNMLMLALKKRHTSLKYFCSIDKLRPRGTADLGGYHIKGAIIKNGIFSGIEMRASRNIDEPPQLWKIIAHYEPQKMQFRCITYNSCI